MIDALRIIAARSPYAGEQAMQCIKAVQVKSPVVKDRYNRVVGLAFGDPQAEFTPQERQLIASYIDGGESESKTQVVHWRVTPSEYADLKQLTEDGGHNTVSDYLRSLVWPE
jgi:hypothetical protein